MAARGLDGEIDRLYQLPLADFTAARNALAKSGGAHVRALAKPTVPAWAVNQLYWRERKTWSALIDAAETVRRAHKAVLAGRAGDLRDSGKAHDRAVESAVKSTLALLAREGQPVTDATRQGIMNTLRALPSNDAPGRLTETLRPGGFELLAGLRVAGSARTAEKPPTRAQASGKAAVKAARRAASDSAARTKARARARAELQEATRKLRQAEQAARREEFEAARAAREADRAERLAAEARASFEAAREALEGAEATVPAATRARDAAAHRAKQAGTTLAAAQAAVEAAEERLAKV